MLLVYASAVAHATPRGAVLPPQSWGSSPSFPSASLPGCSHAGTGL